MTQIINKTTAKTASNLHQAFETVYTDFNREETVKDFWQLINKPKFTHLLESDPSFKQMISDEKKLDSFKNSLLKLKNYCSQNQPHQEINLVIVENKEHKHWIRELS